MFSKTLFVYPLCNCWRPAQSSNSVTGGWGFWDPTSLWVSGTRARVIPLSATTLHNFLSFLTLSGPQRGKFPTYVTESRSCGVGVLQKYESDGAFRDPVSKSLRPIPFQTRRPR